MASKGDKANLVISATPLRLFRLGKLGGLITNTTLRAENAIQLTSKSNVSAARFYKLMNPTAKNLHLNQGFKSANGIKWSYYKGGTTNSSGWTIKGITPEKQTIILRFSN
jgi:hypothetical protein